MSITPSARGFSLIELLVAVAIASLLVVALTMFVARSFTISREQFEQVQITEDARLELERISDAIRNARYVDRNNNGITNDPQEGWLVLADRFDIAIFTNIDGDTDGELVRYFIEATAPRELKRTVTQLQGTAITNQQQTSVLSKNMRNIEQNQPLFTYYAPAGTAMPVPVGAANLTTIARVGLQLVVDVNDKQKPDAAVIATDVTPRTVSCTSGTCQLAETTCLAHPDTPLGPYQYSGSNFIEAAGETCQAYCNSPAATPLPSPSPSSSCPWSAVYAWDGASLVTGYCSCSVGTYPSPLPDLLTYGAFTDYYKEKWNFCKNTNQDGNVICDFGEQIAPGTTAQCTYQCNSNNNNENGGGSSPTPSPGGGASDPPVFTTYTVNGGSIHRHNPGSMGCTAHTHVVNWVVANADSCTASGVWSGSKSPSGMESVLAQDDGNFTLDCVGPGGQSSATVPMISDIYAGCN